MKNNLLFLLTIVLCTFATTAQTQTTKKVLFIGNSYTGVNNLPSIVNAMAVNTDDILVYDSNSPGGFRFLNHAVDAITLAKINADTWDYVVLQAQSQETALSQTEMQTDVYPYATSLSTAIRENNECSQPLFYMTWGRESGDANLCQFLPWTCTYEGMDDAIKASYLFMAEDNNAEVAPAGAVWRYLRTNFPGVNLYASDSSHPSEAGYYAAACALYTMIFKKDPTLISWNYNLSESQATIIRTAAKTIVFDQLALWDFTINPSTANFTEEIQQTTVTFTNTSENFDSVAWNFGDGTFSSDLNPIHTYATSGSFEVLLSTSKCGKVDLRTKTLAVNTDLNINQSTLKNRTTIFPNPTTGLFKVNFNQIVNSGTAALFDSRGTMIFTQKLTNNAFFTMDISHLSTGIYTMRIIENQAVSYAKIIKI